MNFLISASFVTGHEEMEMEIGEGESFGKKDLEEEMRLSVRV